MKTYKKVDNSQGDKSTNLNFNGELPKVCIGADKIKNLDFTSIDYLVDELIPRGTLCALVGESDTGKSSLLRQLGLSISYGDEDFIGFRLNWKCRNVIYVSTEDGEMGTSVWLNTYLGEDPPDDEKLSRLNFIYSIDGIIKNLRECVNRRCIDLIVIDSYADIFSGSMNNSNEVRTFLQQFASIASEFNVTIIFLHHTKKSSAGQRPNKNNILGSQGFEAKMRSVLMLTKDKEDDSLRHLCVVKNNYMSERNKGESYILRFNSQLSFENTGKRLSLDEIGEEEYMGRAKELKSEGKSLRDMETILRNEGYEVSRSTLSRNIK